MNASRLMTAVLAPMVLSMAFAACSQSPGLPAPEVLQPASAEEAREFALGLRQGLQDCIQSALREQVDIGSLSRRAVRASTLEGDAMKDFGGGFERGVQGSLRVSLGCDTAPEMRFRIEGYGEREGFPTVLISELDTLMEVREFVVGKTSRGKLVSPDFIYRTHGLSMQMWLTESLNLIVEDIFGMKESQEVLDYLRAGDTVAGMPRLHALSEQSQHNLVLMLTALESLAVSDLSGYLAYRDEFRSQYPGQGELPYFDMVAYASAGKWSEALPALDAWNESLGGLPGLRLTRARYLQSGGRWQEAEQTYRSLLAEEPEDSDLEDELLSLLIEQKDYDAAVEIMVQSGERSGTYWVADAVEHEAWKDFGETPQWHGYREWVEQTFETSPEEAE